MADDDRSEMKSSRSSLSLGGAQAALFDEMTSSCSTAQLAEVLQGKIADASADGLNLILAQMIRGGLFVAEERKAEKALEEEIDSGNVANPREERAGSVPAAGSAGSPNSTWRKAPINRTSSRGMTGSPMLGRKQRSQSTGTAANKVDKEQCLNSLLSEPLTSPDCVRFVTYCESVFAAENFYFLRDVQSYVEDCEQNASLKTREKKAKKIFETYFAQESPHLINVPHRASTSIVSRFGPLSSNIFALSVQAVRQNIQDDILVRYLQSAECGDDSISSQMSDSSGVNPAESSKNPLLKRIAEQLTNTRRKSIEESSSSPPSYVSDDSSGGAIRTRIDVASNSTSSGTMTPEGSISPPSRASGFGDDDGESSDSLQVYFNPLNPSELYESLEIRQNPLHSADTPPVTPVPYEALHVTPNPLLNSPQLGKSRAKAINNNNNL